MYQAVIRWFIRAEAWIISRAVQMEFVLLKVSLGQALFRVILCDRLTQLRPQS